MGASSSTTFRYSRLLVTLAVVAFAAEVVGFVALRNSNHTVPARAQRPKAATPAQAVSASEQPRIAEVPIGPSVRAYPFGLASASNGRMWISDQGCMNLGQCTLERVGVKEPARTLSVRLPAGEIPYGIAVGRGESLWFALEGLHPAIGRITSSGHLRLFTDGLRAGSLPFEITEGPDGAMWFTDQGQTPAIGRINPDGQITEFSHGLSKGSIPFGITTGSAGDVWFTDRGCSGGSRCAIGRITPTGRIHEFSAGLGAGSEPLGIAPSSDGGVWFADAGTPAAIGRVTASGRITEFSSGLNYGSKPVAVTAGADGDPWFADEGTTPAIGRLVVGGSASGSGEPMAVHEYSVGLLPGSEPALIEWATNGLVWFTDEGSTSALGLIHPGLPERRRSPLTFGPLVE